MNPKLLHIYGPIELNSFNTSLLVGLGVFIICILRHPGRERFVSSADFINISIESAIAGIIGGRILHIISQWNHYESLLQMLSIWNGGLSILGAIAGAGAYALWQAQRKGLPVLANFDIVATYAPLIHAIARLGCFGAGCCYGSPTNLMWGVTYTDPLVFAPLNIKIHPTQLYSSLIYFGLFLFLRFVILGPGGPGERQPATLGNVLAIYLMGMSAERFLVDFLRGDRILVSDKSLAFLSFHQWLSLAVFAVAIGAFIVLRAKARNASTEVPVGRSSSRGIHEPL